MALSSGSKSCREVGCSASSIRSRECFAVLFYVNYQIWELFELEWKELDSAGLNLFLLVALVAPA